jgi:hypothetical protein
MQEIIEIRSKELSLPGVVSFSCLALALITWFYFSGGRGWPLVFMVLALGLLPTVTMMEATTVRLAASENGLAIRGVQGLVRKHLTIDKKQLRAIEGSQTAARAFFGGTGLRYAFDGQDKWVGFVAVGTGGFLVIIAGDVRVIVSCSDAMSVASTLRKLYSLDHVDIELPPAWSKHRRMPEGIGSENVPPKKNV